MSRAPLLVAASVALLLLAGCLTTSDASSPEAGARAYAQALREGRLDEAFAHVSSAQRGEGGLDEATFRARYADEHARTARAQQVEAALAQGTLRADGLTLVREENGAWRVREPNEAAQVVHALTAFVDAAQAEDFEAAWAWLSSALRARYSPSRLAEDFRAEPEAKARLERARAASAQAPILDGDEARFDIGEGRAVRLVREADGWRVAALE